MSFAPPSQCFFARYVRHLFCFHDLLVAQWRRSATKYLEPKCGCVHLITIWCTDCAGEKVRQDMLQVGQARASEDYVSQLLGPGALQKANGGWMPQTQALVQSIGS